MSNIIKIKHGTNPPAAGVLAENELGYSSSNHGLYLGKGTSKPIQLNDLSGIQSQIDEIKNSGGAANGVIVSADAPDELGALWIDISHGGIAKYYSEVVDDWVAVPAVWG